MKNIFPTWQDRAQKDADLQAWWDAKQQEIEQGDAEFRQEIIDDGILESWVNLHRTTTPENRAVIKDIITRYGLNDEANEIVRRAHKK